MFCRVLCVIVSCAFCFCGCAAPVGVAVCQPSVLIDPGHGGVDGGAVAPDGTLEKDINLAISLVLRDMLRIVGVPIQMTRDADCSIHSEDAVTIREKKVSDLQNRLALYEQSTLVISVHQNRFEQEQYRGTQVFYASKHPNSKRLAAAVQKSVVDGLQPPNHRKIAAANDAVYLMYHTTVPAVLIECGFLSNPSELEQLTNATYQQHMAWAICVGYWNYIVGE